MKQMKTWMLVAILTLSGLTTLSSCGHDDDTVTPNSQKPIVIRCIKPDYLKAGDKVALISPSYYTPMENVEATAAAKGIYTVSGQFVGNDYHSLPNGIYVVDGKKIVK